MKIAIIDCGSDKTKLILEQVQEQTTVRFYDIISIDNLLYAKLNAYDAIIISGAPILLSQEGITSYLPPFQKLDEYQNSILGICFGHQILGALEGAEIQMMPEERDWTDINHEDNMLFQGLPDPVSMRQDHCEEITQPDNYTIIATSKNCSNEAMAHNELPRWGVQFHPEASEENGKQLIKNFLNSVSS